MTSERDYTTKQMKELRAAFPGCEVTKHCENFTSGVPDVSFVNDGPTWWIENKRKLTIKECIDTVTPVQREKLRRLWFASNGRAIIACRVGPDRQAFTLLVHPVSLMAIPNIDLVEYIKREEAKL